MDASKDISRLIEIMAALRTPVTGCPWDLEQTFETIKPYTIEEAYEVADAIERRDMDDLCEELGDLLLQVVFHARMAEEAGDFAFGDVVEAITRKMIRRHPHVFDRSEADTPGAVKAQWDAIKQEEKRERAERRAARAASRGGDAADVAAEPFTAGFLGGVHRSQPALTEALKLQERAAKVGFDWAEPEPILDKIEEEVRELREALQSGHPEKVADELGDLLFAVTNIGRHVKADPEQALRGTNTKFRNRFRHIETELARSGETLPAATLARMEELWQAAKAIERAASPDTEEAPGSDLAHP
jgi:ATP diphosphatase